MCTFFVSNFYEFINKKPLEELITVFKNDTENKVDLASLMFQISDKDEINNPNNVKVIKQKKNEIYIYVYKLNLYLFIILIFMIYHI
jgi:CMP-2-keto-3-deoxyoctulosonic acid synthetase